MIGHFLHSLRPNSFRYQTPSSIFLKLSLPGLGIAWPPHHRICGIFRLLWLWPGLCIFRLDVLQTTPCTILDFLSPAVSSSRHTIFILWFYHYYTLKYVITSYVLLSCDPSYVSPTAVIVDCVRSGWITDSSSLYTGTPFVFICSGVICWWFGGLCWGPVGVIQFCTAIPMFCVGISVWIVSLTTVLRLGRELQITVIEVRIVWKS